MKTALLIDGGYLRASAKRAGHVYDNSFIERFAPQCIISPPEYLFRVFYYDSPQFRGQKALPVSGAMTNFQSSDRRHRALSNLDPDPVPDAQGQEKSDRRMNTGRLMFSRSARQSRPKATRGAPTRGERRGAMWHMARRIPVAR